MLTVRIQAIDGARTFTPQDFQPCRLLPPVSRKEQKLSKVAAAIYVNTQDDIRRSGATTIPDLLRMVPGLASDFVLSELSDANIELSFVQMVTLAEGPPLLACQSHQPAVVPMRRMSSLSPRPQIQI
jgi:hypothetical protein